MAIEYGPDDSGLRKPECTEIISEFNVSYREGKVRLLCGDMVRSAFGEDTAICDKCYKDQQSEAIPK